ncbi:MAG: SGNH/GDSL hydrolase family protein [Myxococcota bacterium]
MSVSPEERPAGSRRWPLLASAVLSPLVFLALFEALLFAVGFGGPEPLFRPVEARPGWLEPNPGVLRRYFPTRAPTIAPETAPFPAAKADGTLRLVVQGGSTAAGFPYGRFAGMAEMLAERFEASFPERRVEIVSAAMAAVNSYTLLDCVDEILAIEPDAVLIQAGHNEYLGVLGVGSGLTEKRSRAATLLHLRLRRFRVYQYLQALIAGARDALADDAPAALGKRARHLMARAASGAEIPHDSAVHREGLAQFEANLSEILARYAEAGVPVFVGTPVSNEKDQPPFASDPGDDGAAAWFARGRAALAAGDAASARRAFRQARDRDRLPFRAPAAFEDVVRRLAAEHGATVVEVQARFAAASPDGLVGDELLLEHVHPNADGYFLLADAFWQALGRFTQGDARPPGEARRDAPITPVDRVLGDYAVRELEAGFPFVKEPVPVQLPAPSTPVERIAWRRHHGETSWLESMEELLQLQLAGNATRDAAVTARVAARAFPFEPTIQQTTGRLYRRLGRDAQARRYLAPARGPGS